MFTAVAPNLKGHTRLHIDEIMEKYQEQHEDDHDQVYEAEEPEPRYVQMQIGTININHIVLKKKKFTKYLAIRQN